MFYGDIFSALSKNKIRYAVAGGVAVNLHGLPRMTADLDLLVDLQKNNLERFLEIMRELGYRPRLPVPAADLLDENKRMEWISARNLYAFTFWNEHKSFQEIDILLKASEDTEVINRAETVKIDDINISVLNLDDLIEMKSKVGRKQDKADVEALTKLKNLPPQ